MEPISADLLALVINDPKLKDISPLARQRIGRLDLSKCDIADLSPLQGLPLDELSLEDNARLADITALRGMPLQKLYLSRTRVENLGPLRGAPLEDLNLLGARVKDLSPLAECPIKMLWLTGCPVEDISPLRRVPLVSLTLQDTRVSDLSPLAGPFAAAAAHRRDRSHRFDAAGILAVDAADLYARQDQDGPGCSAQDCHLARVGHPV